MGGTFYTYDEPDEHNVLKDVKTSLPSNVTKADLIRMGLSPDVAEKTIDDMGHRNPNEPPPGGYIGGGDGGDRPDLNLRRTQIHAAAPPDAKIDEQVFDRMITAQTPMHLMGEIQKQLDHCRQQVIKPDQSPRTERQNKIALEGKELEIDVALYFGRDLVDFGREYDRAANKLPRILSGLFRSPRYTEVDVETSEFLIEVTIGSSGKEPQMSRYLNINSQEKHVILYAPNYKPVAERNLTERTGVQIARSKEELFSLCQKLKLDGPS